MSEMYVKVYNKMDISLISGIDCLVRDLYGQDIRRGAMKLPTADGF